MNMLKNLLKACFLTNIILLTNSCIDQPSYSNKPIIDYKKMTRYTKDEKIGVGQQKLDSVVITIGFKDGNGNLGVDIPLSKGDSSIFVSNGRWGNYSIDTYRLMNEVFVKSPLDPNKTLIFPKLSINNSNQAIEGTLTFNQIFPYGIRYKMIPTKFRLKIRDRDLNESNVVETDTVEVPLIY